METDAAAGQHAGRNRDDAGAGGYLSGIRLDHAAGPVPANTVHLGVQPDVQPDTQPPGDESADAAGNPLVAARQDVPLPVLQAVFFRVHRADDRPFPGLDR